jgi:hypothetical protein
VKREDLEQNPFWVLGLDAKATRMEVERAGQKLLAQLGIGAASAQSYPTPWGARPRDEALVRTALAALRDPMTRALSELWIDVEAVTRPAPAAFAGALHSVGWRPPCTGQPS